MNTSADRYDVVIIGGALMGGSTAYHLLQREPTLKLCVIEKDPSYEFAATGRSFGGVRILFSQEENIRMSQFGHEFYGNFSDTMQVDGEPAALDFWHQGYLFLALNTEQAGDMELNAEVQRQCGCEVELMDANELAARFPALSVSDIAGAVLSPNDGWIDPHGALMGFRRKARALGAEYRAAAVIDLESENNRVRNVVLDDGAKLSADTVINTTGAWAGEICAMVGMKIPVVPLSRMNFYFETREPLAELPLTSEVVGIGFRPEGKGYITGYTDFAFQGAFCFDLRHDVFDERIWPGLAHRVPAFEAIKVQRAWAGHYAVNTFDSNLIIGPWLGGLENFYIATGFSGHGLQHAPAVGRALSELVIDGRFETIDLARFTYQRILDGVPYPERGMRA